MPHTWTEEKLQAAIIGLTGEREAALQSFFLDKDLMGMVRNYVVTKGGKPEDGEDVFQETFILFERNLRRGKFDGTCTLRTYFFSIAKWHWVTMRRQIKPVSEFSSVEHDKTIEDSDIQLIEQDHRDVLENALAQLGDKCKDLLLLTGVVGSNEEIAKERGFSSSEMAKKAVYRCREKFRELLSRQPELEKVLKSIIRA